VTAVAVTVLEDDVLLKSVSNSQTCSGMTDLSGVDSDTVVLVVNLGASDSNASGGTNVKGISVVTALGVTILVIKGELVDSKTINTIDANSLNRSVLDIKIVDLGVSELMSREELWLINATVSSLSIPPSLTTSIENSTRALNSDLVSRDLHKRSLPLLVAPGSGSLEDDLGVVLELAEIESLTAGDSNVVKDNGGAGGLGLAGLGGAVGAGEGAGCGALGVGVDVGGLGHCWGGNSDGAAGQGSEESEAELGHFDC
jgi:hypothetical protein